MNNLSLYILDIVQNSINAKCDTVNLELTINNDLRLITIIIIDNGKGIKEEDLNKIFDPFYTSNPNKKIGLGLSLFKELCVLCDGDLNITSKPNVGTKVEAYLSLDSLDLPPIGDISDTVCSIILNDSDVDVNFKYIIDNKTFYVSTIEIKKVLGEIAINQPNIITWLKKYISDGIKSLEYN